MGKIVRIYPEKKSKAELGVILIESVFRLLIAYIKKYSCLVLIAYNKWRMKRSKRRSDRCIARMNRKMERYKRELEAYNLDDV